MSLQRCWMTARPGSGGAVGESGSTSVRESGSSLGLVALRDSGTNTVCSRSLCSR